MQSLWLMSSSPDVNFSTHKYAWKSYDCALFGKFSYKNYIWMAIVVCIHRLWLMSFSSSVNFSAHNSHHSSDNLNSEGFAFICYCNVFLLLQSLNIYYTNDIWSFFLLLMNLFTSVYFECSASSHITSLVILTSSALDSFASGNAGRKLYFFSDTSISG